MSGVAEDDVKPAARTADRAPWLDRIDDTHRAAHMRRTRVCLGKKKRRRQEEKEKEKK